MVYTYLDYLALFGVGGAHPGGLQLTKWMLAKEAIDETTAILDAGCGTGQTSAYLSRQYSCQVTSIDSNKAMVEKARKRISSLNVPVKVKMGDAQNLPFADRSFDLVLSESVIAFTNPDLTIPEFKRVLKPAGRLLAVEMVIEHPLSKEEKEEIAEFYGFYCLFTETDWAAAFQKAGFTDVSIERFRQPFEKGEAELAADFSLSETIDDDLFDIFTEHQRLTEKYKEKLGYRIFRCGG